MNIYLKFLYTADRYFQICSSWANLQTELLFVKQIFLKIDFPENFFSKCLKKCKDNIQRVKRTPLTVEKKAFVLVVQYLSLIFVQNRTKLRESLENIINRCKLQVLFKYITRFHSQRSYLESRISLDSVDSAIRLFMVNVCHLNVRKGEHIGTSSFIKKQV